MTDVSNEKMCQKFLRAAAKKVRESGLARGTRLKDTGIGEGPIGSVCMLGAMDYCGVVIGYPERLRIEAHIAALLPPRPRGEDGTDKWNGAGYEWEASSRTIAWWSNMRAETAEDVAAKFELAAETC